MAIPLDHNGPTETDFVPCEAAWVHDGVIRRFKAVVQRHAAATAIVDENGCLTYGNLYDEVCFLADRINNSSPSPGAVAILLPQSTSFWVAILACLAAGRTYVALDLHHPTGRNAEILKSAGLVAVIAPSDFDLDSEIIPQMLSRISPKPCPPGGSSWEPQDAAPTPDHPAAVLYTSGSTGRPKGLANSETALLQRVAQYVNACHLHAGDRFLTLSSPCTIAGTREGLTALLLGATLHVIHARASGLGDIIRLVRDARITVFNSVPSVLRTLIAGQPDAQNALQSLRIVRIGGEVVFWSDLALFRRALPAQCHIQIGYSSTEATGTQWFVPEDAAPSGPFVPVGYVLPGNEASIVDDAGIPVEPGIVGELVLRSRFIALGTWDQGRCVSTIQSDQADPAARVLHTGDLAHIDASGLCTIVGRKDRQVKINGMRVEPAEIEAALRDLPDIVDAAVIARRHEKAVTLTGFIVPRVAAPSVVPRVRAALRTRLPAPMRPSRLRLLGAIPHLPSGKLDVRTLEMLERNLETGLTEATANASITRDVRQAVHRAWRVVLGRKSLAEGLSFEDSGGDSLKLLQLALWLETLRGRRLPLDLFTGDMQPDDLIGIIEDFEQRTFGIQPVDARPTVFLFPGLDGDEPRLANFRALLEERVRFVLIDYPDWPQMVRDGQTFDKLVDYVVSQVIAAQPDEPLLLAGYSFGGDVAFAAASKLMRLQRNVGLLGILDTDLGRVADAAALRRNLGLVSHLRQIVSDALFDVPRDRLRIWLGFLLAKCARDVIGFERVLRHEHVWRPLLRGRTGFAFHRRIRRNLRVRAQWNWHQDPPPDAIDVPTVLFRSEQAVSDAKMGWRERCPNLTVVPVSGDHHSMLDRPHITSLCISFAESVGLSSGPAPLAGAEARDGDALLGVSGFESTVLSSLGSKPSAS